MDRPEPLEQRPGLAAPAQHALGLDRPHGGVRVQAPVLARAGGVAGEVADLGVGPPVRGVEQQRAVVTVEVLPHRGEQEREPIRGDDPAQDRPRLGVEEDPPVAVAPRTDRLPGVLGGAHVPGAVPEVPVHRRAHRRRLARVALHDRAVRPRAPGLELDPVIEDADQEMREPDALGLELGADGGEAVVPVARPHPRHAAGAEPGPERVDGAPAVVVDRPRVLGRPALRIEEPDRLLQES